MEETRDKCLSGELPWSASGRQLEFMEKLQLTSQISSVGTSNSKVSGVNFPLEGGEASERASQTLWATGKLAEPIPDGFYFITPERRFEVFYDSVPSLDELHYLEAKGFRPNVILVDTRKDKKLSMLKQLAISSVKGLSSSPLAIIKKIAGLVHDFYKCSNFEKNTVKGGLEEVTYTLENHGIHMLCQIKSALCQPRAILFKVLADTVGIESKLIVGLPREGVMERTDSFKHMSVTVVVDSVELLVDLVRFPGKVTPCTSEAIFLCHIIAGGDSESTGNSYDSPIEPNSPVCGFLGHVEIECIEYEESLPSSYQSKLEASMNVSGASMWSLVPQSKTLDEQKFNLSQSEPNVANSFWQLSQKNVVAEHSTAGSSPEPALFGVHGRCVLGGRKHFFREHSNNMSTSRSVGASPVEVCRRRRRCISMIPEIGDDVVRVVRAMNQTLKHNRLPREEFYASNSCSASDRDDNPNLQGNVSKFYPDDHEKTNAERVAASKFHGKKVNSQKAISLPSSPHCFSNAFSRRGETSEIFRSTDIISKMNKVLEVPKILSKQLFPFEEWNVEFSELTVGRRIGIGFFGEVFLGIWNGIEVAIKVFLEQDLTVENIEDFCNEISILSRVRHPNVILFLGACIKPPRLSMVTEYMERGSLYHLIHASGQKRRLNWRRRLKMLCDVCRGLMCIHRMKIAHRDLKSANCLVNKHWKVKICDFGLSRVLTTRPMRDSSSAGTPEWMAPELIRHEPFTEKCDIFSLGVIIWELCTLNRPWDGVPSSQVVFTVANDGKRLEVPQGPLGQLIADCWAEPDERPGCQEILSRLHDYESSIC